MCILHCCGTDAYNKYFSIQILATCPYSESTLKDSFTEMTTAAQTAITRDEVAQQASQEAMDTGSQLIDELESGETLSKEEVENLMQSIKKALKSSKDAKEQYVTYGTACLNTLGLGNKLKLDQIRKVSRPNEPHKGTRRVNCIYCKKPFDTLALASDHMLRVHHQEIALRVNIRHLYFACTYRFSIT